MIRYDQWRRLWEIKSSPRLYLSINQSLPKILTMASNGGSPRLQSEVRIPQRDGMISSLSPVDTPREEPVQAIPL